MPEASDNGLSFEHLLQVDADTLYRPDGSLDMGKVKQLLGLVIASSEFTPHTQGSEDLEDLAGTDTKYLSIDSQESQLETSRQAQTLMKSLDPRILDAFTQYLAGIFESNIEVDYPSVPPSDRLEQDPGYIPNFGYELERYLGFLQTHQPVRYRLLQDFHNRLTPPTYDVNSLDVVVAIPLAGHQETGNIFNTLSQIERQHSPAESIETVLFVNVPGGDFDRDESLIGPTKQTLAEIERFMRLNPHMSVRYVLHPYRGNQPDIGTIRSDLFNLIAYDMQVRGRKDDIKVLSWDSDAIKANRLFMPSMLETARITGADAVASTMRWQPVPGLPPDAMANRILRYQDFLDSVRDNHSTFIHTPDASTMLSLAMFMAVGGYNRETKLAEMDELTYNMHAYRNLSGYGLKDYNPAKLVVAKSHEAVLTTHSRRLLMAMALGYPPYYAWDQDLIVFGSDDSVRTELTEPQTVEAAAQQHWQDWLPIMTAPYLKDIDPVSRLRLLKAAHKILKFNIDVQQVLNGPSHPAAVPSAA